MGFIGFRGFIGFMGFRVRGLGFRESFYRPCRLSKKSDKCGTLNPKP